MKKILAICVVLVMVFCLSTTAFAAPNGFVSSPSDNKTPEIETVEPSDENCIADLGVTSYADRFNIADADREALEAAYADIADADDLADLSKDLEKLAKDKKVKTEDLLVSDLFNISAEGCKDHNKDHELEIVLSVDTLKNFVGLMYNDNGKWVVVDGAKVVKNGTALKFSVATTTAPFAIVVSKGATSPQTEDGNLYSVFVIMASVAALATIVCLKKSKNQA
ncbi:MAG: hypothetical protein IKK71_06465 [Clostridia bacterium]|nr:hypothetical protein [Clostridia bacterium]